MPTPQPVPTEPPEEVEVIYEDYFGFGQDYTFTLPDGKQTITYVAMNEGQKAAYQSRINKELHFNRRTDDARIKTDPAGERHALIHAAVTGWSLMRRNPKTQKFEPVTFSSGTPGSTLNQWLLSTNPKIVEELEEAIRKVNPWLTQDMTVEQVDEEIERLSQLREDIVKREKAKAEFQG
jgi:hypothetical protein